MLSVVRFMIDIAEKMTEVFFARSLRLVRNLNDGGADEGQGNASWHARLHRSDERVRRSPHVIPDERRALSYRRPQ
jgi:hypothetical protein